MKKKEKTTKANFNPEDIRKKILDIKGVKTVEYLIHDTKKIFNFIFRDEKDERYGLAIRFEADEQEIENIFIYTFIK